MKEDEKSRELQSETQIDLNAIRNAHFQIPSQVREFPENFDYISLYPNWLSGNLRLTCNSILDSLIVLPDGSVPICQNLNLKLGNVNEKSLDEIFNSEETVRKQKHYSKNCNQCWISYHRKYDIALYKNFEKFFGRKATSKLLGYYKWDADENPYDQAVG
jgi:MoaA/NifB/PqqE/SkfB family radical SAM enzyme